MVRYVKRTIANLPPDQKPALGKLIAALSAEAGLARQRQAEEADAASLTAGRELITSSAGCVGCHKFRDAGDLGSAPDLTGYGSREWLLGMISNPTHERYYRDENDRMPSFAPDADEKNNILTAANLGLLVDWLRHDWYEPAGVEQGPTEDSAEGGNSDAIPDDESARTSQ